MGRPSLTTSEWREYRKKFLLRYREARGQGHVDVPIVPLLDRINAVPDYVTTSSCSGRIVLLATTPAEKKGESFFYRKWHRPVIFEEVFDTIRAYDIPGTILWLKVDPFIIHVAARDLDAALRLLDVAHRAGIKTAGIISADGKKYHVEIRGIDSMAVPVWDGGTLVGADYLSVLLRHANRKMVRNAKRLAALFDAVSTLL